MQELDYIEELFKSEELVKNKHLINALLQHADIYRNPKSNAAQKAKALEHIKMIGSGKMPKAEKPPEKAVKQRSVKPGQPQAAPAVTGPAGDSSSVKHKVTPKYHPLYQHYNIDKETWNKMEPHHKMKTLEFHNEVMAGKHPAHAKVRDMVHQKMKKSVENIRNAIRGIKEELEKSGYGPKGAGQYTAADNIKRKQSRTGNVVEGIGHNKAVRSYSTKPGQLSAKQSAASIERKKKKLSGPVKVFSPEEIKALEAKKNLSKP